MDIRGVLTPACFFLLSVGYKVAWTAISSLLGQYSRDFGPHILLHLNIAYFFPSIPVLLIQSYITDALDKRLGPQVSTLMRFCVGYGGLMLLTANLPQWGTTAHSLLLVTALVGMSYGVAFGTSYQLASKFSRENTVALTTGFVSCGVVVLAFDLTLKSGPYYTPLALQRLFTLVSLQTSLGLLAAVALVLWNWRRMSPHGGRTVVAPLAPGPLKRPYSNSISLPYTSLRLRTDAPEKHQSAHETTAYSQIPDSPDTTIHIPSLMASSAFDTGRPPAAPGTSRRVKGEGKAALPTWTLLKRIAPAALSLSMSVGTSMLVFPFFTYSHSTGLLGEHLHQVLFYVRLIADIAGRIVPSSMQARTAKALLFWGVVKAALTPLLILGIFKPWVVLGDPGLTVLVAAFWILSGYINTCAYLLAPQLVPPVQGGKVGGLMASAFQCSCFVALMMAFGMQQLFANFEDWAGLKQHLMGSH